MSRSATLHGAAPDTHPYAVLVIDLISDFSFPDGEQLARAAARIAKPISRLCERARRHGVPVVFVNDHRGRWRSDRDQLIAHCSSDDSLGQPVVRQLAPQPDDYFIFKPKHSCFYATPLEELLRHLGASKLVLTGSTIEQCVLFTAIDAYVRDFELVVPPDCVTGVTLRAQALAHMKQLLDAQMTASTRVRFGRARKARRATR
jgi:nicotinamidase-related amidase